MEQTEYDIPAVSAIPVLCRYENISFFPGIHIQGFQSVMGLNSLK